MCGRYALIQPAPWLRELLGAEAGPVVRPRYNIAPGQRVPIIRLPASAGEKALAFVRWGLVPPWAEDPSAGATLINARSETVAVKPAFRAAFHARRCLIPADGFYEWGSRGGARQPYFIHLQGNRPFCFAGLWVRWTAPDGGALESCAILTTQANGLLRPIHPRMPVILSRSHFAAWLAPAGKDLRPLRDLLKPYPRDEMAAREVGSRVNSPRNEGPGCLAAAPSPAQELPFQEEA